MVSCWADVMTHIAKHYLNNNNNKEKKINTFDTAVLTHRA